VRGTRAGVCVLSLSPICGSRVHFLRGGVKLDSDYSGSASLPNFLQSSSLRGFILFSGAFRVLSPFFEIVSSSCLIVHAATTVQIYLHLSLCEIHLLCYSYSLRVRHIHPVEWASSVDYHREKAKNSNEISMCDAIKLNVVYSPALVPTRCASSAAFRASANTLCSQPTSSNPILMRTSALGTPYCAAQSSSV